MKLIVISLISLCCFLWKVTCLNKETFFERSILRKLIEANGSYSANIEHVGSNVTNVFAERYSFNLSSGQFDVTEGLNEKTIVARMIYSNRIQELYQIVFSWNFCAVHDLALKRDLFLVKWAPKIVYENQKLDYAIYGPTVLLLVLLDNIEKADCLFGTEAGVIDKCDLRFKDESTEVWLEYYFDQNAMFTMIPKKILVKMHENDETNVKILKQYNYFRFVPDFDEKNANVDNNLPIGFGCKRVKTGDYPSVETRYGNRFEMKFESVFQYIKNTDQMTSPEYAINRKDKTTTRIHSTVFYRGKNILIADGENELTNKRVRTIYSTITGVNYDVMLDDDSCVSFIRPAEQSINYFYVQDLFVHNPEFFYANDYEFIGQYSIGDLPCLVFEKNFENFTMLINKDKSSSSRKYLDTIRQNINGIYSDHLIVTHYYPILPNYWDNNMKQLNVPVKIEIRIFASRQTSQENLQIAKQTINIVSFDPEMNRYDIYDMEKCSQNAYDFDLFQIRFNGVLNEKKISKFEMQIKNSFLDLLQITPLRVKTISMDMAENTIYLTAKLIELPEANSYFRSKNDLTIENPTVNQFATSNELCARRCLTNKNCAAYSYCLSFECKLWIDEQFDRQFNISQPGGKEYYWQRIETFEAEHCYYNERIVKFDEKIHLSNEKFLNKLEQLIENNELELIVVDENYQIDLFNANELKVNMQFGNEKKQYQAIEHLNNEHNAFRYNHFFDITDTSVSFSSKLITAVQDVRLIISTKDFSLEQCQSNCVDDGDCASMSYCFESNECILTSLANQSQVLNYVHFSVERCAIAFKKHDLVLFNRQSGQSLEKIPSRMARFSFKANLEECASTCRNNETCHSFDYCHSDDPEKEGYYCYIYDENISKSIQPRSDSDCDHYTYKNIHKFIKHESHKLASYDIGMNAEVSLEVCAFICERADYCNEFDYCIDEQEKGEKITNCRLSTGSRMQNYSDTKISCAVYSKKETNKLILVRENYLDHSSSGRIGMIVLCVFALLFGCVLGIGLFYRVTNRIQQNSPSKYIM